MPQSLKELFDFPKLQELLDSFYLVTGVSASIMDTEGVILVSSARPELCSKFYECTKTGHDTGCRINRNQLFNDAISQKAAVTQSCKHGLLATIEPIIIRDNNMGALLIGQVFNKEPDLDIYRQQAQQYGFDETEFMRAVEAVPVVDAEKFENIIRLMSSLTFMLADQGVARQQAVINERKAKLHADRMVKETRNQKAQLKMYELDQPSCNDLLDQALEEALDLCDSQIGYIYQYDEDTRLFTLYAWSHSVMSACKVMPRQTVYELDKTGLWGEAVRQRKAIITNDFTTPNEFIKGCPEGHVNLVRHLNLPIFRNNRIVAVVGVGNKESDYTDNDTRQLQLFMGGVWNIVVRRKMEEELAAAKALAESSSRMKSELLANLSHELRTPLNGIIGSTQLLRFTDLTPEQEEYLGMLEDASIGELTLVNNLLELVRLESEGIRVDRVPFSLRLCIDEIARVHDVSLRTKGLVLNYEMPANLPDLIGDKVRITQILNSLLGNAIKFTDEGTVTIKVEIVQQEAETVRVRFSVLDTGVGIQPEKLDHIFEPFIQSDMSITRKFGGLGLGLAICHRLATALGGHIWAESMVDIGSCFYLELPLEQQPALTSSGFTARQFTILLAEDEHISSLTSSALLRKMGHTVVTADNGRDAVDIWSRNSFDLILMDLQMPLMDGFEALQAIRKLEAETGKARTPVVAQTAYARWNYQEPFVSTEFDGFISKPLLREELEAVIAACCASV